jgi:hypothetical protein
VWFACVRAAAAAGDELLPRSRDIGRARQSVDRATTSSQISDLEELAVEVRLGLAPPLGRRLPPLLPPLERERRGAGLESATRRGAR